VTTALRLMNMDALNLYQRTINTKSWTKFSRSISCLWVSSSTHLHIPSEEHRCR
jgi:hypothetical protein